MSYVTLVLPFNACCDEARKLLSTAWLFKVATHRMLSIAKQISALPATDIGWKSAFRKAVYEVIPNRRYTDGVITLVRSIYESCRQLGVDFKSVELGNWLMFQQSESEYPVRNITLKHGHEFHVTTISYNGSANRVIVKPTIPKNYRALLDKIIEEKQEHTARVVVKGFGVRKSVLWVHGEVHLTIPIEFYYRHVARYRKNGGRLYGGVDVNVDRINLTIVDEDGRLRDRKTFWFREVTARGCPRRRAWSAIGTRVHEMLSYAYHHGVKTIALENPNTLGALKLMWAKSGEKRHENYNYKVSIFRCKVVEMIAMKAPLYDIEVRCIDPRGTTRSREHEEVAKKYRLDRHTASAYLIALRALEEHQ